MKDIGIVRGSARQAVPLIIGVDTVYVHTDITPITTGPNGEPVENEFSYREVQYEKDEYIKLMAEQNKAFLEQLEATQEALDFLLLK